MAHKVEKVSGFGPGISIELGTPLQLEFLGVDHRFDSMLVGFNPGRYAIVTVPASSVGLKGKLRRGNVLTVRYLHSGTAYAFQAQILGVVTDPVRLVFLGCPKSVQEYPLRAEQRMAGYLPCRIKTEHVDLAAVVADVSRAGCRCLTGDPGTEALQQHMGRELELVLKLPGVQEEVPVKSTLRSMDSGEDGMELGMQFDTDHNPHSMEQLKTYLDYLTHALGSEAS